MRYVADILNELADEPGKIKKLEILKANQKDGLLKMIFDYALDPFKVYNIKKIPEYNKQPISGRALSEVIRDLHVLMNRTKTGHAAQEWLALQLESLDEEESNILERIIKKDMRCGVSVTTVNKIWPGLIFTYPIMLCEQFTDKAMEKIRYPAIAQHKMDGARINIKIEKGRVELFSRSGKPVDLKGIFDNVAKKLAGRSDMVFDGEIIVREKLNRTKFMSRKKGNGIVNKAIKGTITDEEISRMAIVLWDTIYLEDFKKGFDDTIYGKRLEWLEQKILNVNDPNVLIVPSKLVRDYNEAIDYYNNIIDKGGEGIVLKNVMTKWEDKRSKDQIKIKAENECDLKIKELEEGEGKYKGKLGAFVCVSSDGLLEVNVGLGFSDEQRVEYFNEDMIGKIVAVKFNEVIEKEGSNIKSLYIIRFIEVRTDKSKADSLKSIENQKTIR